MDEGGRLKLVADVALFAGDRVLLVRYRDVRKFDGETGWFLPDDYLRRLEHPEDAAKRILREQIGLEAPRLRLGLIESFEGNGAWHLIFHYEGHVDGEAQLAPGENTAQAEWFRLTEFPDRSELAHEGWALDVLEAMRTSPAGP